LQLSAKPVVFAPISRPLPPVEFDPGGLGDLLGALTPSSATGIVVRRIDDLDSLALAVIPSRSVFGLDARSALTAGLAAACVSLLAVGGWWKLGPELVRPQTAPLERAEASAKPAPRAADRAEPYLGMALADAAPARPRSEKPSSAGSKAAGRPAIEARAPAPEIALASAQAAAPIETPPEIGPVAPPKPIQLAQADIPTRTAGAAPDGVLVRYQSDQDLLGSQPSSRSDRLVEGGLASLGGEGQRLASAIAGF
jgi:hypothetical protein